jgi:hypothetical protein
MANGKLKRPKSPGIDRIQTEPIIAGCRTIFFFENTKLFSSIRNKEEMLEELKESIIVPIS